MDWLDIIGLGIIFPTVVALVSYLLIWEDKKIEALHFEIINRLLSFSQHRHEQSYQTIRSLSLEGALYEIDHILEINYSLPKEILRVDVAYDIDPPQKKILENLKSKVHIQRREKLLVIGFLIFGIIVYCLIRNGIIEI